MLESSLNYTKILFLSSHLIINTNSDFFIILSYILLPLSTTSVVWRWLPPPIIVSNTHDM